MNEKLPLLHSFRPCQQQIWTWSCTCVRPLTLSRCLVSTPALLASQCCCHSSSSCPPTSQPALSSKSGKENKVISIWMLVHYLILYFTGNHNISIPSLRNMWIPSRVSVNIQFVNFSSYAFWIVWNTIDTQCFPYWDINSDDNDNVWDVRA